MLYQSPSFRTKTFPADPLTIAVKVASHTCLFHASHISSSHYPVQTAFAQRHIAAHASSYSISKLWRLRPAALTNWLRLELSTPTLFLATIPSEKLCRSSWWCHFFAHTAFFSPVPCFPASCFLLKSKLKKSSKLHTQSATPIPASSQIFRKLGIRKTDLTQYFGSFLHFRLLSMITSASPLNSATCLQSCWILSANMFFHPHTL